MQKPFGIPSFFPVTSHTDCVGQDSIFVAIQGHAQDGIHYCVNAIEKGARTLVIQNNVVMPADVSAAIEQYAVVVEIVDNTRKALAELSALHAMHPAKKLKIIGVTGTKGKTTTCFLIEQVLRTAGHKVALLSSAKNKILDTWFAATLTTPQPDYLHQFLKVCVDNEVEYVVMEVAAQALSLYRVYGIDYDGIIFTNFSHEHLEFYATLDEYFDAKYSIFSTIKDTCHVMINADDERGQWILSQHSDFIGYSLGRLRDTYTYTARHMRENLDVAAIIVDNDCEQYTCTALFGLYNAYNVMATVSLMREFGIPVATIKKALGSFTGVPGRLEQHNAPNSARFFIDYAHNPDSFNAVLSTLRLLTNHLIVVFGAGGGKDKLKRPIMGCVASEYADVVIITSDNPRLEDQSEIANEIIVGIASVHKHKVMRELDRKRAIECAYELSHQETIIALLGKGPDEYQLVGTKKYFFSEKDIIKQLS